MNPALVFPIVIGTDPIVNSPTAPTTIPLTLTISQRIQNLANSFNERPRALQLPSAPIHLSDDSKFKI